MDTYKYGIDIHMLLRIESKMFVNDVLKVTS